MKNLFVQFDNFMWKDLLIYLLLFIKILKYVRNSRKYVQNCVCLIENEEINRFYKFGFFLVDSI